MFNKQSLPFTVFFLIALLQCLLAFPVLADWKTEREGLEKVHIAGPFRIFYSETGKHALNEANLTDKNAAGTPAFIQRIGAKLLFARRVYIESFGLADPLQSERFKGRVQTIDIHFIRLSGQGSSGDGIHHLDYRALPGDKDTHSLIITLSSALAQDSVTPEHELFHTFQYGYTSIKNAWFSEGSARWADYVFKPGTGSVKVLPRQLERLENFLSMSYSAKFLWRRLAQMCDTNQGHFSLPKDADISGLYETFDFSIHGYPIIRTVFENLNRVENSIAKQRGYEAFHWHETEKKSQLNDKVVLAAIKQAILDYPCQHDVEVRAFLKTLDAYLAALIEPRAKDVTELITDLGIPYAERYTEGPSLYARNIWTMHLFNDAIYLGAGNAANDGPAPNAGPVPIIRYEPKTKRFVTEGSVDEEQIDLYREIGGKLFIPGFDATKNSDYGNFYARNADGSWQRFRTIPKALHVFDLASYQSRLLAAIGTSKGAAVAISSDQGQSWELTYLGEKQRVYNLMEIGGVLYAAKQLLPKRKIKELSDKEQENYFSLAEFRDGEFVQRPDLDMRTLFPAYPLKESKTTRLARHVSSEGRLAYIGAYYYNNPFGVFVASSLKEDDVAIKPVKLPVMYKPIDLLIRNNKLYILCNMEEETGYRIIVMAVPLDNSEPAKELFNFTASTIARSFELYDGDFYFGMGNLLKSKRHWKVEDISEETGKILMLSQKHIGQ